MRFGKLFATLTLLVSLTGTTVFGSETSFYMDGVPTAEESLNWNRDLQAVVTLPDGYERFVHHSLGYSFEVPGSFTPDVSLSGLVTVLADERTRIEVYHDNFAGTVHTPRIYSNYSLGFRKDPRHHMEMDYWTRLNGGDVHIATWTRDKLARVPGDMNHYFKADFVRGQQEVITVFVKSQDPISIHDRILSSFRFESRIGTPGLHRKFVKPEKVYPEPLNAYYQATFSKDSPQRWGIFHYGATENLTDLKTLEKRLDYKFGVLVRYQTLDTPVPMAELQRAWEDGRAVELTLQTMFLKGDLRRNSGLMYQLLNGEHDAYLRQYAKDLKAFGKPVLFRLNNEMNGEWCEYSAYHYSADTELYKAFWKYLHKLFREEGADNVLWIWNPHDGSFPGFAWNNAYAYFPGEAYVDIVGLTGYNTGTYYPGERWRSFDEIYPSIYREYNNLFDYPMMITEFGSNEVGGDKAAWVRDMFSKLPGYRNIKVVIWFNGTDRDAQGNPARIYRLDSQESVVQVFRENLNQMGMGAAAPVNQ